MTDGMLLLSTTDRAVVVNHDRNEREQENTPGVSTILHL